MFWSKRWVGKMKEELESHYLRLNPSQVDKRLWIVVKHFWLNPNLENTPKMPDIWVLVIYNLFIPRKIGEWVRRVR
jgi:hypothetical protein